MNVKILDKYLKANFSHKTKNDDIIDSSITATDLIKTSERIQSAVTQIRSLLNILSFATCENFDELYFTNYSMAECVQEALDYYPFYEDQKIHIITDLNDDFQFYGSKELMTAVFFNLIKNAQRAIAEKGTGEITITLQNGSPFNKLIFRR